MPRDYLSDLPAPSAPTFGGSQLLQAEFARAMEGAPPRKLDPLARAPAAPTGKDAKRLVAWQEAARNAEAQLEHAKREVAALELLQEFGGAAWRVANRDTEKIANALSERHAAGRKQVDAVNQARKRRLDPHRPRFAALGRKWAETASNNLHLEVACAQLERDVKRLRSEAAARGIALPDELGGESVVAGGAGGSGEMEDS